MLTKALTVARLVLPAGAVVGLGANLPGLAAICLLLALAASLLTRRGAPPALDCTLDAVLVATVFAALYATGRLPWYRLMEGFAGFTGLLIAFLLVGLLKPLRQGRRFPQVQSAAMVVFVLGALAMTLNNRHLVVERPTITIQHLPAQFDGLRAAVLADPHIGWPDQGERWFRHIVLVIDDLHPDIIFCLGDILSYPMEQKHYISLLGGLHAPMGVWGILGNHENGVPNHFEPPVPTLTTEQWRKVFADAGVHLLENQAVPLRRGQGVLWLVGVGDVFSGHARPAVALEDVPPGAATIVLTHSPDLLDYPQMQHVGLVLAGHTHGGGVWLPFVGPIWASSTKGRLRAAGLVHEGTAQAYISRGAGSAVEGLRLGNSPEVTLLTLRRDR